MNKITAKDTIITANKRQALALEQYYLRDYGTKPVIANIIDYRTFIIKMWQRYASDDGSILLNPYQQSILWQRAAADVGLNLQWDGNTYLLKNIEDEYALVCGFMVDIALFDNYFDKRSQLFFKLIKRYRFYLSKYQYIDEASLADWLQKLQIKRKYAVYYYGFKTPSPKQRQVFDYLNAKQLIFKHKTPIQKQLGYLSATDEIDALAKWLLENMDDKRQLAVVVPELSLYREQIAQRLDALLGYDKQLTSAQHKSYNISLGMFLSEYPLVANALCILEFINAWHNNQIEVVLFRQLIKSAFILNAAQFIHSRHIMAYEAANQYGYMLNKQQVFALTKHYCPVLYQQCCDLDALLIRGRLKTTASHSTWMDFFTEMLRLFGWLSDYKLDSTEFQTLRKYQESQRDFRSLDLLSVNIDFKSALMHWSALLKQTIFQAKSAQAANIHIIGRLEAQGLWFDKAWVMGVSSDFLPGRLKFYRFIDSSIAKRYHLPNSQYEQLAQEAEQTLFYLQNIATSICFSYHQHSKQGFKFPSPYLHFEMTAAVTKKTKPTKPLEKLDDALAPPFKQAVLKAAVKTLTDQSQCAFKGFANRLAITEQSIATPGVSPKDKGIYIHKVLESIWRQLERQSRLLALTDLLQFIKQHIEKIYAQHSSTFWAIEAKRAEYIIINFLKQESIRADFKVLSLEQNQRVNIAGLIFNIRLDRIDSSQGRVIIFDYKTSQAVFLKSIGFGRDGKVSNIEQPQLAIYALNNKIDAFAFIQLNSTKIAYIGCTKSDVGIEGLQKINSTQFKDLLSQQRQQLETLSNDIQKGKAAVLPQKGACRYCQLDSLCRIPPEKQR